MVFPWGAVVASVNVAMRNNRKNHTESEEKKQNIVKEIIVTYEDGSSRTIKHGFAVEAFPEQDKCLLDYKDCTDQNLLKSVCALAELVKEKGLITS